MNSRSMKLKLVGLACALLVACGGSGGGVGGIDPGGGIGGSGMTSSGSISAFGSIFAASRAASRTTNAPIRSSKPRAVTSPFLSSANS